MKTGKDYIMSYFVYIFFFEGTLYLNIEFLIH